MNGRDRPKRLWKNLKRRLRFNGLGACCGPSWNTRVSDVAVEEVEEAQYYGEEPILEANYGSGRVERMGSLTPTTQFKTLMRLFEETDGRDEKKEEREIDTVCCVCMERNKGAAFIPCGHTYCRICSRELWLNRGLCPPCNRPIDDILHIF